MENFPVTAHCQSTLCSGHCFKAYGVLHSFVRDGDNYQLEDAITVTGYEDAPYGQSIRGGLTANNVRNKAADYFLTDAGAVPWQM